MLVSLWIISACGAKKGEAATLAAVQTATMSASLPTQAGDPPGEMGCTNPDCVSIRPTSETPPPLRLNLPTPGIEPISAWRPPQYPVPLALGEFDHFYFARPIAADVVNWPVANYRYGGTELSPGVTHTGVDIPAKTGTPVLATGPGIVTWAGWGLFSGAPDNDKDPYGMAVSIRHDFGYQGQPLYTIYAHMEEVDVAVGQWVNTGDQLGLVGATGNTTGPHLHFEVRLGKDSIFSTRNPELWIAPPQGWGVLAGRVMSSDREPAHSLPITIRSKDTGREWIVNTYGPTTVNPDEYYNENMVISDLPAGQYLVLVGFPGQQTNVVEVTINPGRVSYFVYRESFGFTSTALPPVMTPNPEPTLRPGKAGANPTPTVPQNPWQSTP